MILTVHELEMDLCCYHLDLHGFRLITKRSHNAVMLLFSHYPILDNPSRPCEKACSIHDNSNHETQDSHAVHPTPQGSLQPEMKSVRVHTLNKAIGNRLYHAKKTRLGEECIIENHL